MVGAVCIVACPWFHARYAIVALLTQWDSATCPGLATATVFSHDKFNILATYQQEGLIRVRLPEARL